MPYPSSASGNLSVMRRMMDGPQLPHPSVKPRSVCLLGGTGSVGQLTTSLIKNHPHLFHLKTVVVLGSRSDDALALAKTFGPDVLAVMDSTRARRIRDQLHDTTTHVLDDPEAIRDALSCPHDITVAAISGIAGLDPLIWALPTSRILALANKEAMICAASLIHDLAQTHDVTIVPVDSEHSALSRLLEVCSGPYSRPIQGLTLPASGGAVRDMTLAERQAITPQRIQQHPIWTAMGPRLMVDSATMMNKLIEMIEAKWLFDVAPHRIRARYHPQGIIHALVDFCDGVTHAVLGPPDMTTSIARALWWPFLSPQTHHDTHQEERLMPMSLSLDPIDEEHYPLMKHADAFLCGPQALHIALNAANEVIVNGFLMGRLSFNDMIPLILQIVHQVNFTESDTASVCSIKAFSAKVVRVARHQIP